MEWGYNNLFTSLDNNSSSIDDVVENFSTLLFDDAYQYFGKTVRPEDRTARHPRTNPCLIIHVKLKNKISIVRNMSTADVVQI